MHTNTMSTKHQSNYREFEPEKEEHADLADKVKAFVGQYWHSTPEIFDSNEVQNLKEEHGWAKKYLRYRLLPGALNYLRDEDVLMQEERREGGQPTHYWKLSE